MNKPKININNRLHSINDIEAIYSSPETAQWEKDICSFIFEWFNKNNYIEQKTSGSTGTPKTLKLKKTAMLASAQKTLEFFKLKKGEKVLLCLPAHYIAGKMMMVRAIAGNLNLIIAKPEGIPEIPPSTISFAAMVPIQLHKLIENNCNFSNIENLIVGGAAVDDSLLTKLKALSTNVYATYGMTETCSHIALQKLNGTKPDPYFRLLNGFSITTNSSGCLVIDAPEFSEKPIETTDLVDIVSPHEFRWLGRADNIINSGGIKILPEQLEHDISEIIQCECLVAGIPDTVLGQKIILIIEKTTNEDINETFKKIKSKIEKHRAPKEIFEIENFVRNESMKIDRKKTIEILFDKV